MCIFSFTRYKCHKECVQNAPPNCGLSEEKLRRVIDKTDIQNALGKWLCMMSILNFFVSASFSQYQSIATKISFHPYGILLSFSKKKRWFWIIILASDSISPTSPTPMSVPGSPTPNPQIPGYHFNSSTSNGSPSICVSESIYCSKFLSYYADNIAYMNDSNHNHMI